MNIIRLTFIGSVSIRVYVCGITKCYYITLNGSHIHVEQKLAMFSLDRDFFLLVYITNKENCCSHALEIRSSPFHTNNFNDFSSLI